MADECLILKDRNVASEAIRHLDEEDLRSLNRRLVDRRMEERNRSKAKQKTISVLTDKGHPWNVYSGLLSLVEHKPKL